MKKQHYPILMGGIYILAGINHFINPNFYMQIMPPYLPIPLTLVYLSGVAEIVSGVLLMPKTTRKIGAWCTIALLVAVFPANIQMSIDQFNQGGLLFYVSLIRLPLQFLLIYWAYLFTRH